jgi:proteasome activator subunit 4
MILLVSKMRRFYDAGTTDEVLDEFRPLLCPHDHMCNQAQGFLCLFLPSNNGRVEWLREMLDIWIWNDNNPYWDFNFFFLFRRLAQDSIGLIDWTPHLELIFTRILRSLDLPIGSTSRMPYNRYPSNACSLFTGNFNQCKILLVEHCAYLIAWILSPQCPEAMNFLKKLFKSIESYYHPSNGGNWSSGLGIFLQSLCKGIARRALLEKSKDSEIPVNFRLTDSQIHDFVQLVLPIAQTAIYGKSTRLAMSTVQSIKHLAYLAPGLVLPPIMERVFDALQTLTETHQTTAAMGLLSVIIFPMMKSREFSVRDYIRDLMSYSLPGIDTNDPFKTYITIKFYTGLLTVIPLFTGNMHPSSKAIEDGDDSDLNDSPLAVQFFEDWAIELLNHIFRVLITITIDRGKQQSENSDSNLPIRGLMQLFFMQLSPQLHRLCLRKVIEYLQNNFTPNSDKFVGDLCHAASRYVSSVPEDTNYDPCGMILDVFYRKLIDERGKLNQLTKLEMTYYTYLISRTVQSCPSLLKHKQKLFIVLDLIWNTEEKKVIKNVGKLIKNLLQSLTTVYPLEFRSVNPSVWSSEQFSQSHWRHWGEFYSMNELDIQWHVPSKEELEFATLLYNTFVDRSIQYLQSLPEEYSRQKIMNNLMKLRYVLRGSSLMLPEMHENIDSTFIKYTAKREVNAGVFEIPEHNLKYTRYQIAQILHHTFESLLSMSDSTNTPPTPTGGGAGISGQTPLDQTNIFTLLLKCYYTVICLRGNTFNKTVDNSKAHKCTKRNLFKSFNEKHRYPRTFLVQRAYQILQSRVYMKTIPFTDIHTKLLEDLKLLSLSEYSKVRSKAQNVLVNSLKLFNAKLFERFLPDIIRILADPKSKNSEVNGAIYTLQRKTIVRKVTDSWNLLGLFMTSICQSYFIEKASIQNRLNSLFVSYSVAFKELKLQEYVKGEIVDHTDKYNQILNELLSILKEQNLHWRYELMLYTTLVLFIRSDYKVLASMDIAEVFLKSLVSDVIMLRNGALKAVSMVLTQYRPVVKKKVITNPDTEPIVYPIDKQILAPVSAEEYRNTVFHDKNYYGWNCKPKQVAVYDYTVPAETYGQLEELKNLMRKIMFDGDWMEKYFEYLASQPRMDRVSFAYVTAHTLKGMFQIMGIEFLEHSKPHFEKLFSDLGTGKPEERNAIAFASEFIAALARGAKHWPFEDRRRAFDYILPHLKSGLMNCSQNCVPDWHAALRFCVYDLDVRRCVWLRDALMSNMDLTSGTTAMQAKTLGYLFPVLSEFSWRDPHTNQHIAEYLFPFFDYPYQLVRQKIASILTLNFRFMWRRSHSKLFHNRTPELEAILQLMASKLQDVKEKSVSSEEHNSPAENLRKMCSSMIATLVEMASNLSVIPYLDIIIPMLFDIYAETNHSELQKSVRKVFLSISASLFPAEYVTSTLSMLAYQKEHGNHKLRIQLSIFLFLQNFAYRHQFYLLHPAEEDLLFKMLEDGIKNSNNEIEVRELACITLGDFIRIASDKKVHEFVERFKKVSATKKRSKSKHSSDKGAEQQEEDPLYVVFGLSALVRSCPYDIPDWLPDILIRLASYQYYRAPKNSRINAQAVNETVKKTFAVFLKTQRDQWHISKKKLSEEQLFEITSLFVSPVYYV